MGVPIEQLKWAVRLQMRERPPVGLVGPEDDPTRWGEALDGYAALAAFSRQVSAGADEERLEAVHALVWLDDRRAVSPLIRALSDGCSEIRSAAARGLGSYFPLPSWTTDALRSVLADASPTVRAAAARTIASAATCEPVDLLSLLEDPSPGVRLGALDALDQLGAAGRLDRSAASVIHPLLYDRDVHIAYRAYWALAYHGGATWEAKRAEFRWSDAGQRVWSQVAR